jgi:hypothetical protein
MSSGVSRPNITPDAGASPKLCPACALAVRTDSRLYHVRCLGPTRCECTHELLREVLFRG